MASFTEKIKQTKVLNQIIALSVGVIVLISGYLVYISRAATCTVSTKLVNSCRPWLGAAANKYPGVTVNDYKAQLLAHESAIGRQVDVAHTYHAVGSNK